MYQECNFQRKRKDEKCIKKIKINKSYKNTSKMKKNSKSDTKFQNKKLKLKKMSKNIKKFFDQWIKYLNLNKISKMMTKFTF